jgi:hypothetical protein
MLFREGVLLALPLRASNEGLPILYTSIQGSGQGYPLLRASSDHRFIVGALRAKRAPGRSFPNLLRPRVARAQEINRPPSPSFQARLFHSLWNGTRVGSTAAVERGPVTFLNLSLGEWPRLPSIARIGRAPLHRARSASKEGTWPLPATPSQRPERLFEELLGEGHMLLDVCLQFARACFPVVSRVADAAGKTDKLL